MHLTWTIKRLAVAAGAKSRSDFLQEVASVGVIAVEFPIRDAWTPSLPPYTCVTLVKHVLGLGPGSLHIITPQQLLRYLRKVNGR